MTIMRMGTGLDTGDMIDKVVVPIEKEETGVLPEGYFWVDYATLNRMVQINNCLNIQLRNLLSLLDI